MIESGPLRASVKITVPLGAHGDCTFIATVLAETPYLSFKADVRKSVKFQCVFLQNLPFCSATLKIEDRYPTQRGTSQLC